MAFDTIHALKCKRKGRTVGVALKIDINKTYDRMDWNFLKYVLCKMGFSERLIHWMHLCMRSVTCSFLVNNELVRPIIPQRGLRQGDPLSQYLFLVCAEGLSSLICQQK